MRSVEEFQRQLPVLSMTGLGCWSAVLNGAGCSGGENLFCPKNFKAGRAPCKGIRENSLKSFTRAAECGADFVELDVQVWLSDSGHSL